MSIVFLIFLIWLGISVVSAVVVGLICFLEGREDDNPKNPLDKFL